MKKERKRRIKIRVLSNEGYSIDAELDKEMPIEEVLSTLEELGFKHFSNENLLQDKKHEEDMAKKIIQNIHNEFLTITQGHGESIKSSEKFYESWIKMGFDIVDLKYAVGGNVPTLGRGEGDSRAVTAIIDEEPEKGSHNSNTPFRLIPEKEEPSSEHSVIIPKKRDLTPRSQIPFLPEISKPAAPKVTEVEEELHEIRSVFSSETKDSCKYCSIFRDMGNIVCPNCGRALNLKISK
jgi:hypothetical protein